MSKCVGLALETSHYLLLSSSNSSVGGHLVALDLPDHSLSACRLVKADTSHQDGLDMQAH